MIVFMNQIYHDHLRSSSHYDKFVHVSCAHLTISHPNVYPSFRKKGDRGPIAVRTVGRFDGDRVPSSHVVGLISIG